MVWIYDREPRQEQSEIKERGSSIPGGNRSLWLLEHT